MIGMFDFKKDEYINIRISTIVYIGHRLGRSSTEIPWFIQQMKSRFNSASTQYPVLYAYVVGP